MRDSPPCKDGNAPCESGISILAWRTTLSYAYSPFNSIQNKNHIFFKIYQYENETKWLLNIIQSSQIFKLVDLSLENSSLTCFL